MTWSASPFGPWLRAGTAVALGSAITLAGVPALGLDLASAGDSRRSGADCGALRHSPAAKDRILESAKIAVFPPYIPGNTPVGDVHQYVQDVLSAISLAASRQAGATVEFDYRQDPQRLPPAYDLWTDGSYSGRPDVPEVLTAAERIGADFVLMFKLDFVSIRDGNGYFVLHLIDAASGNSSQVRGDARAPRPAASEAVANIERLHSKCLQHTVRAPVLR